MASNPPRDRTAKTLRAASGTARNASNQDASDAGTLSSSAPGVGAAAQRRPSNLDDFRRMRLSLSGSAIDVQQVTAAAAQASQAVRSRHGRAGAPEQAEEQHASSEGETGYISSADLEEDEEDDQKQAQDTKPAATSTKELEKTPGKEETSMFERVGEEFTVFFLCELTGLMYEDLYDILIAGQAPRSVTDHFNPLNTGSIARELQRRERMMENLDLSSDESDAEGDSPECIAERLAREKDIQEVGATNRVELRRRRRARRRERERKAFAEFKEKVKAMYAQLEKDKADRRETRHAALKAVQNHMTAELLGYLRSEAHKRRVHTTRDDDEEKKQASGLGRAPRHSMGTVPEGEGDGDGGDAGNDEGEDEDEDFDAFEDEDEDEDHIVTPASSRSGREGERKSSDSTSTSAKMKPQPRSRVAAEVPAVPSFSLHRVPVVESEEESRARDRSDLDDLDLALNDPRLLKMIMDEHYASMSRTRFDGFVVPVNVPGKSCPVRLKYKTVRSERQQLLSGLGGQRESSGVGEETKQGACIAEGEAPSAGQAVAAGSTVASASPESSSSGNKTQGKRRNKAEELLEKLNERDPEHNRVTPEEEPLFPYLPIQPPIGRVPHESKRDYAVEYFVRPHPYALQEHILHPFVFPEDGIFRKPQPIDAEYVALISPPPPRGPLSKSPGTNPFYVCARQPDDPPNPYVYSQAVLDLRRRPQWKPGFFDSMFYTLGLVSLYTRPYIKSAWKYLCERTAHPILQGILYGAGLIIPRLICQYFLPEYFPRVVYLPLHAAVALREQGQTPAFDAAATARIRADPSDPVLVDAGAEFGSPADDPRTVRDRTGFHYH